MHKLLLLFLCILTQYQFVTATITVIGQSQEETFSVYDPIKMYQQFEPITGVILPIQFGKHGKCQINRNMQRIASYKNGTISAITMRLSPWKMMLVRTIPGAKHFTMHNKWLRQMKLPSIKALVLKHWSLNQYFSDLNNGALSHMISGENKSRLPTVLTTFESYKRIEKVARYGPSWTIAIVAHESSAWNDILLSNGYSVFLWIAFVINALFVIHGFGRIAFVWVYGRFRSEFRTLAFAIAQCSVILSLASMFLFDAYTFKVVWGTASLLFNVAIYLVLIIWFSLNSAIEMRRAFVFKSIIHITSILIIIAHILDCISLSVPALAEHPRYKPIYSVTMALQMLISAIFLYFAVIFYKKLRSCISNTAKRALLQLIIISIILFLSINILCIDAFIPHVDDDLYNNYYIFVVTSVLKIIAFTGQSAGLIYLLGLRMPDDTGAEGGSVWMAFHSLWGRVVRKFGGRAQPTDAYVPITTVTQSTNQTYSGQNTFRTNTTSNMTSHSPSSVIWSNDSSQHQTIDRVLPSNHLTPFVNTVQPSHSLR
ncbi:hypothetical protein BDF19DRAFT_439772 [Syncephalis fuscata]|nr:hypothetical protein BDF19DRAFT_439772 [Syncephalis fuscata]